MVQKLFTRLLHTNFYDLHLNSLNTKTNIYVDCSTFLLCSNHHQWPQPSANDGKNDYILVSVKVNVHDSTLIKTLDKTVSIRNGLAKKKQKTTTTHKWLFYLCQKHLDDPQRLPNIKLCGLVSKKWSRFRMSSPHKANAASHNKSTSPTVNHSGGSVMTAWGLLWCLRT